MVMSLAVAALSAADCANIQSEGSSTLDNEAAGAVCAAFTVLPPTVLYTVVTAALAQRLAAATGNLAVHSLLCDVLLHFVS